MITTFYPPFSFGGDGVFVQTLANGLAELGHHVEVIHCRDAFRISGGSPPKKEVQDHPGITVHGLKSAWGPMSPFFSHQTGTPGIRAKKIRQILEQDFDVIHYHNISLMGGPQILSYGKARAKLYTMHEFWLVCPTHVLYRYKREPCRKRTCLPCTLYYKRPPQLWRYLNLWQDSYDQVDAFITPSKFSQETHKRFGFEYPIIHLPNFVPEKSFAKGSLPLFGKLARPYFLFIGRLEKIKGVHTLISVFKNYPHASLVVAGSGSQAKTLEKRAKDCSNIHFLGHVSERGAMQALYKNSQGVIIPSSGYDIAPLVAIEAFQQKTPVIVRNLGGLPEAVEKSGAGFIFENDEDLVLAMDRLALDNANRDELGKRGYEAYKSLWSKRAHFERYFQLIHTIAKETDSIKPIS